MSRNLSTKGSDRYKVYKIELSSDYRIPVLRDPESKWIENNPVYTREYMQKYLKPDSEEKQHATFHWFMVHHRSFIYWQVTGYVCERVSELLAANDYAGAAVWLKRLAILVRGTAAAMTNCGEFDPALYDGFLRPAMEKVRDDFSADSSADFTEMMKLKISMIRDVSSALKKAGTGTGAVNDAYEEFRQAEKYWMHNHLEVIKKLHPGDSLLQKKLKKLQEQGIEMDYETYLRRTVQSPEAQRDYDGFFGIVRNPEMTLESYWNQILYKMALLHRDFHLPGEKLHWIMLGDAMTMSIVSELMTDKNVL